jgi:hypothetical protein
VLHEDRAMVATPDVVGRVVKQPDAVQAGAGPPERLTGPSCAEVTQLMQTASKWLIAAANSA